MDEESSSHNRPECRAGHITVVAGKYVFIWGGYNNDDEDVNGGECYISPEQLWVWDTEYRTWQWVNILDCGPLVGLSGAVGVLAPVRTADRASQHCALYIIGGHGLGHSRNSLFRLDISAIFLQNSDIPHLTCTDFSEDDPSRTFSPRDKFTGWEHEGNIYIFGGFGPDIRFYLSDIGDFAQDMDVVSTYRGWNNQLLKYDVQTSAWSLPDVKGSIPLPRAAHGVAKLGNQLYMFGGRHQSQRLNDLHVLDMLSFTWTKISIFDVVPTGRSWHSFNRISDHQILLFGGYPDVSHSHADKPLCDAWLLDVKSWRWTQMAVSERKAQPRLWHTGVQSDVGEVTVFGGCLEDILNHHTTPKYSNSLLTFRILPKSLARLSMDAAFQHRTLLKRHFSHLPRNMYNELLDREISTQSVLRWNPLRGLH